jgi:hypothetical protein
MNGAGKTDWTMPPDQVCIVLPNHIHNNFGIDIECKDPKKCQKFVRLVALSFDRAGPDRDDWQAFFQGGSNDPDETGTWKYFEFWCDQSIERQDRLWNMAQAIADQLTLPLGIR